MRLVYAVLVFGNGIMLAHDGAKIHMLFFLFVGAFGLGLGVPKKVTEGLDE